MSRCDPAALCTSKAARWWRLARFRRAFLSFFFVFSHTRPAKLGPFGERSCALTWETPTWRKPRAIIWGHHWAAKFQILLLVLRYVPGCVAGALTDLGASAMFLVANAPNRVVWDAGTPGGCRAIERDLYWMDPCFVSGPRKCNTGTFVVPLFAQLALCLFNCCRTEVCSSRGNGDLLRSTNWAECLRLVLFGLVVLWLLLASHMPSDMPWAPRQ